MIILPNIGINKITIDHNTTASVFFSFLKVKIKELITNIISKGVKTINNEGLKSFISIENNHLQLVPV